MWIEDLTKALYFLNATEYKYSVCIEKIGGGLVWFSNHKTMPVQILANLYDNYIRTGEVAKLW